MPRRTIARGERFYEWVNFHYWDHWYLDLAVSNLREIDIALRVGKRMQNPPQMIELTVREPGKPMDFSTTLFGVPVASPRATELLLRLAPQDVQLIPCRIDGVDGGYSVVNIVSRLNCVDKARSRVIVPASDSLDAMHGWVIDPAKANGHTLFRLDNDPMTKVVSEALKSEIERLGLIGPGLVTLDEERRDVMLGYKPEGKQPTRPGKGT